MTRAIPMGALLALAGVWVPPPTLPLADQPAGIDGIARLVSLQQLAFRDFTAEEFMGNTLFTCIGPGGCRSAFKGSTLTLGQMADACVYFGK
jgi:hypothetical protein